jgi:hypothetical protein
MAQNIPLQTVLKNPGLFRGGAILTSFRVRRLGALGIATSTIGVGAVMWLAAKKDANCRSVILSGMVFLSS